MSDAPPEWSVVRVCRLPPVHADPWGLTLVAPGIGDRGTLLEVLNAEGEAPRYVVESVAADGSTRWLAEFARDALEQVTLHPPEPLDFVPMASGAASLRLGCGLGWEEFDAYAARVMARLSAREIDRAEEPSQRVWTIERAGLRCRLVWEQHTSEAEVSLEPCDGRSQASLKQLREELRRSRPPQEVAFRLLGPEDAAQLRSGCAELDFLLNHELGSGDFDDDSLSWELAQELCELRAGTRAAVRNGSDAMFVEATPVHVHLHYALPQAERPGALVSLPSFLEVYVRWCEHLRPEFGKRMRALIWPALLCVAFIALRQVDCLS